MLSELDIRCFKALADVTVTLAPFTVVIGANASGKSSLLDAIDLLEKSALFDLHPEAPLLEIVRGGSDYADRMLSLGTKSPIRVAALQGGTVAAVELDKHRNRLEARVLRAASRLGNGRELPRIEEDGGALAALLQHVQLRRDGTFERIESALRQVVPSVRAIRTMPDSIEEGAAAHIEARVSDHEHA